MDWRFNTIWFDKIENNLLFSKDYKKNQLLSNNTSLKTLRSNLSKI